MVRAYCFGARVYREERVMFKKLNTENRLLLLLQRFLRYGLVALASMSFTLMITSYLYMAQYNSDVNVRSVPSTLCPVIRQQECPKCDTSTSASQAAVVTNAQPGSSNTHTQRVILFNFGHGCCERAQKKNCETGMQLGRFTECHPYRMSDVDPMFIQRNSKIFDQKRGAGYWLWKPYFFYKLLQETNEGDILFYTDAGSHFQQSPDSLIALAEKHDIVLFTLGPNLKDEKWTKRDAFVLMNVDTPEYSGTGQLLASFVIIKNSWKSKLFVANWLTYASDERAITDLPNQLGKPNYPAFQEHRHDQSVLSLLGKKWNVFIGDDPSQWGDPKNYIIMHTRDKS